MSEEEEDTHSRILRAAGELVRTEGWPAVSIRRVARDAGVSVGSVQYYFSTSAELLDAVTEPWHRDVREAFERCATELSTSDDPVERLIDLSLEIYGLAQRHDSLVDARRTDTLTHGRVAPRRAAPLERWLATGSRLAASRLGGRALEWQLVLQGVEFLVMGFALTPIEELQKEEHKETIRAFLRATFRAMGEWAAER